MQARLGPNQTEHLRVPYVQVCSGHHLKYKTRLKAHPYQGISDEEKTLYDIDTQGHLVQGNA